MARDDLRRDQAGIGPDPAMAGELTRMSEVRYRVADGEPDVRGWEVRTLSGSPVGKVDDMLIDPHRGEVVMLDIDLNDSSEHINLPLRGVQVDRDRHCIIVDSGDVRTAREGGVTNLRAADIRDPERRGIVEEVVVRRRILENGEEVENVEEIED